MSNANYYIEKLALQKHPEGGWFKEVYRSGESIAIDALDNRFSGPRSISTSIYFLLKQGEFSAFHKIKSDEIWHFHDGGILEIYSISPEGKLSVHKLGLNIAEGELPQINIPHGHYFAAKPKTDFTLVSCTVAPGFDFEDFELPKKADIIQLFPELSDIIEELAML